MTRGTGATAAATTREVSGGRVHDKSGVYLQQPVPNSMLAAGAAVSDLPTASHNLAYALRMSIVEPAFLFLLTHTSESHWTSAGLRDKQPVNCETLQYGWAGQAPTQIWTS